MKNTLLALTVTLGLAAPAGAYVGETFPMTNAPLFGEIPTEIAETCAQEAGVESVDDLITDSHFEIFEACGIEYLGEV